MQDCEANLSLNNPVSTTVDYRVEPRVWVPETVPCVLLPDSPATGKAMEKGNSGLMNEEGVGVREVQKTPLYRKMSMVTHGVIFLYAAAFWIQIGAMPVSRLAIWLPMIA